MLISASKRGQLLNRLAFKPTAGQVVASSELTPAGSSYEDIPGVTLNVTPAVASTILIWGRSVHYGVRAPGDLRVPLVTTLSVDGTDEGTSSQANVTGAWQARREGDTDNGEVRIAHSFSLVTT